MPDALLFPKEPSRVSINTLDDILMHCVNAEASDITIQTGEPIVAEVFGKLHKVTRRRLSNNELSEAINGIYGPNGTAQILSGKDVDTHYEIRPSRSERYRFRINGTGCLVEGHDGIQITARTIPDTPPPIEEMNLPDNILNAMAPDQGIIYVTGATGSGKSTLLASIIRDIASQTDSNRKILTYEAPIEFVYDSIDKPSSVVSQSEIPRHLPSFAAGVRNALRRKPRLILVGESRDVETISASMEAAMTGHPVYTTLHSNSVSETIRRLVTTYPAEERTGRTIDIIETVRMIISQKLVPTIDGKRVALREYLVFDESVRDFLLECDPTEITARVRELVKKQGQTMLSDAKEKLDAGIIPEREYKIIAEIQERTDRSSSIL